MPEMPNTNEETLALKKEKDELVADRKIVNDLMNQHNDLEGMTRDEFQALMERDNVFEGVANHIFALHNEKNKEMNEMYPLMVKLETT